MNSLMDIFILLLHLLHQYTELTKSSSRKINCNSVGKKPAPFLLLSHKQILQIYWLLEGFLLGSRYTDWLSDYAGERSRAIQRAIKIHVPPESSVGVHYSERVERGVHHLSGVEQV